MYLNLNSVMGYGNVNSLMKWLDATIETKGYKSDSFSNHTV